MEYKIFHDTQMQIKADANNGYGVLSGYAAVFGNRDRVGDIIVKGAFSEAIPGLLRDGVVLVRHGTVGGERSEPIAMLTDVKQDDYGLHYTAEYHSTEFAQDQRKIAQERLAHGKSVPNSLGYKVAVGGAEYKDGARYLRSIDYVPEISTNVWIPANPLALSMSVKDGLHDGLLTLVDEVELVLTANRSLAERIGGIAELRTKSGRVLSSANVSRVRGAKESATQLLQLLDDLLDQALGDPDEGDGATGNEGGRTPLPVSAQAAQATKSAEELLDLARKEYARFLQFQSLA